MTNAQVAALLVIRKWLNAKKVSIVAADGSGRPFSSASYASAAALTTAQTAYDAAFVIEIAAVILTFNTSLGATVIVVSTTGCTTLAGDVAALTDLENQLDQVKDTLAQYPPVGTRVFNNAPSHTIQTVAAAANGWLIDASRDAQVNYSVSITTTLDAGAVTSGYVVLEVAPTNSVTAGDWVEIARFTNTPAGAMIATFAGTLLLAGNLTGIVPAGYYVRLRSVNVAGVPTYAILSGQEVKL